MKNLKIVLITMSFMAFTSLCTAQKAASKSKKDRYEALKIKLDLNDSQISEMKAIDANYAAKHKELKAKIDPKRDQLEVLKLEKKENKKSQIQEIEGVLTPEQLTKYRAMKQAHKEKKDAKAADRKAHLDSRK